VGGDIRFNTGSLDMNSKPVSAQTFTTGGGAGIPAKNTYHGYNDIYRPMVKIFNYGKSDGKCCIIQQ
jgi:hypothetical protein